MSRSNNEPASNKPHDLPSEIRLRPMTLDDLDAVFAIEEMVYPTPFSHKGYRHELTQNRNAHYFVLEPVALVAGFAGLFGYVGHWFMLDEGHISVISVHPTWQGNRFGELLLVWSLRQMVANGSVMATLEVRESNLRAQHLYRKYGFEIVGTRKRYYRDTNEDGLIMTVESLDAGYAARLEAVWARLMGEFSAEISTKKTNLD